jgi:hypothetical protein
VDRSGGDIKGAAEKLMAFWRLDKHMFIETPARPSPKAKSFRFLILSKSRIKGDL